MPITLTVALVFAAVLVAAVPARRLRLDGRSARAIAIYLMILVTLALGVVELERFARYLLPLLGLVFIAPFLTWPGGIDRLLGSHGPVGPPSHTAGRQAPRNVTPRDGDPERRDREP
ncbi:MAG: hypothetical protein IVW53_05710 [Chloroflexi bacterium]|nr:hypothetical protein [Chloroflexota bacterium]